MFNAVIFQTSELQKKSDPIIPHLLTGSQLVIPTTFLSYILLVVPLPLNTKLHSPSGKETALGTRVPVTVPALEDLGLFTKWNLALS